MGEKYSILINTCDAYSDAWYPFFRLLEKNWPEARHIKIYINTERKVYQDTYFNVEVLNCISEPSKTPWGMRLLQAVERIESDYILFLLEDFYFEDKILFEEIDACVRYLESDRRIASFCLTSPMECSDTVYCMQHIDHRYPGFVIRKQRGYYKYDAGPSLWRKSKLVKCTFKADTPWQWEFFGNMRTWFTKDVFYGRISTSPVIFNYDIIHGGAIHRGKWVGYKMREIQEKYNIDIDMSKRDVVEDWMYDTNSITPAPWYKRIPSILRNRTQAFCSILYGMFIGRYK